jgi:hypothetical protein
MGETRSANAEPRSIPWGAVAQLVFFVCLALFMLVRCVIVMSRGFYRLGRNADGVAVIASKQPVEFYGSLIFWAAIAVMMLVWAIRRFRGMWWERP